MADRKISICEDCEIEIVCAIKRLGKKECSLYRNKTLCDLFKDPFWNFLFDQLVIFPTLSALSHGIEKAIIKSFPAYSPFGNISDRLRLRNLPCTPFAHDDFFMVK